MPAITQVTTVKGRYDSVRKNIKRWLDSGIDQLVIVDYNCPEETTKKLLNLPYKNDPRLVLMRLTEQLTGPFYNHAHARNCGAQCARHEYLFFLDADCIAAKGFIDKCKEDIDRTGADVITAVKPCVDVPDLGYMRSLPIDWSIDGQLLLRNAALFDVNGFSELLNGAWSAVNYDMLLRLKDRESKFLFVDKSTIRHEAHSDEVRSKYLSTVISPFRTKQDLHKDTMRVYAKKRKQSFRALPGQALGVKEPSPYVRVWKAGQEKYFNPGEDI